MLSCAALALSIAGGCSSAPKRNMQEEAARGPVIINPRSDPETVELNRFLQARQPYQVYADIQDLASPVTEAKLRFQEIPLEIPMQKVGGTTWRAELNSDQIKGLAISGKTMDYKADIVAKDQRGTEGSSEEPVKVSIKAPKYEDSG